MSDLQDQIARMGFDAVMAQNLSEIVRITRETTIEECAQAVEKAWPLGDYPSASENADSYRAQDAAVRTVLKVIRRPVKEGKDHG